MTKTLEELLETNQPAFISPEKGMPRAFRAGSIKKDGVLTAATGAKPADFEPTHDNLLQDRGYNPAEWRITSLTDSEWDVQTKAGPDTFYAFKFTAVPRGADEAEAPDISELLAIVNEPRARDAWPVHEAISPNAAWIHALGDLQLFKMDGDGVEGTLRRVLASIDEGVTQYRDALMRPSHVHIAWLGDCIEGFVSQGGKNAWRTNGTITEQVRLLRRIMLYAIDTYAPYCQRLTVVSVPGNHDEAMRHPVNTRSDDSWAVDALVAVSDAIALNPDKYGHVECYVPGNDEQDVTLEVGGKIVTHLHGHQFRIGREWQWWQGQAFGGQQAGLAKMMLYGHQHHFQIDSKGDRLRVCVPALESESTWWKHKTGEVGAPGGLVFTIIDGAPSGFTVL
jgi:predicted phosphodiesterase